MAQKINVELVDDLDGSKAEETVSFGLDGSSYEIDLSKKNAQQLRDTLAKYVGAGRRASRSGSGGGRGRRRGGAPTDRSQLSHIRQWAREQGLNVSERGRISAELMEKYQSAHS